MLSLLLKVKLEGLLDRQIVLNGKDDAGAESTVELVALLRDRIEQLEDEKRQSLAEDQRQNAVIEQLNQRESNSQKQIEALEQKLDASDRRFGKLKNQFDAMMQKLGLSGEASSNR